MKLTVSCAEILNTGHNLRHDTVFPHETTDVHVRMNTCTNTETYEGPLQIGKHTHAEARRRAATILQVCSYVVPTASSFHDTPNVFFFAFGTPHPLLDEFFFFFTKASVQACSSKLSYCAISFVCEKSTHLEGCTFFFALSAVFHVQG